MKTFKIVLITEIINIALLIILGILVINYLKISSLALEDKFFHRKSGYQFVHIDPHTSFGNIVFTFTDEAQAVNFSFISGLNNVLIPNTSKAKIRINTCDSTIIYNIGMDCDTKEYANQKCIILKINNFSGEVLDTNCLLLDKTSISWERLYYIITY